jgi:multiple sugar transport system substrate-binding protein
MSKARTALIALTILLVTLIGLATAQGTAFDWRSQSGKQIRVILIQGPWYDAVRERITEFELATGIFVDVEVLPENQAWEKLRVEMQARSSDLDAFYNQTTRFGAEFVRNGWYEPLDGYLSDPSLTSPDFDYPGDFPESTRGAVTFGGQLIAIPTDRDLGRLMFYRADLLDEYGIAVPTTLDELEAAAAQIHAATGGDVAGIVNRGRGASATSQFAHVLNEFGGRWEDEAGNPTVDTPEAIAAFDWWGRTLRLYGPPGTVSFDFPETLNEFLVGKAAFSLEGAINPGQINNPNTSQVAGKVGYAVVPHGPGGPAVRANDPCAVSRMFGISISPFSEKKEAAWLFVQWLAGQDAQLDYLLAGRLAARNTAWQDPAFAEKTAGDRGYWDAMETATQICYPTPQFAPASIVDQGRARDVIGQVIGTSILGGDVAAAAREAQRELVAIKARQ